MSESQSVTENFARIGVRIFSRRLYVGLAAVALGALFIHPRNLFGSHWLLGETISFLLVIIGLALRTWAGGCAGKHTRKATIEAPRLATGGPYAFVRNPIYLASIILGLGMVGLLGDPWMLTLYIGVFVFLYAAIVPAEEKYLRATFGEAYEQYTTHVPRMFPRLTPWPGASPVEFDQSAILGEARLALILVAIYFVMHGAAWLRGLT